ncbi:MAG: FAD-dependent oxidoreductase, partial [Mycoplasmatales bacterium]
MEKVVVIGTNHAGTHAVTTLTEYYKESVDVVTYDAGKYISFLGCGMALWIGNVIDSGDGLFYASPEGLRESGAKVFMEHEMVNADFDNKVVTILDHQTGETIKESYDKLILGIGSWPILPKLPGHDLENIIYAKIFENAQHVIEVLKDHSIKRVAVVGAGYIGVELAEAFKQNGKEIVLISDANVLNRYYDTEFQDEMAKNLTDNGIECHLDELVTEFIGTDGKISGLKTTKGEYEVQLVLMSVGFRPRTEFLNGMIDMLPNGAIITNNK